MKKIQIDYDNEIPILKFSECMHCSMPYGKRDKGVPKRGCCWYDAEFDLFDLKHLVDVDIEILYKLIENNPYQIRKDNTNYAVVFLAYKYHGTEDKENKVCRFFKESRGCSLPIHARPFICRITVCPQARLHFSPEDYQQVRQWISEYYQYRLQTIEIIKEQLQLDTIDTDNIYDMIHALQKIPPLQPFHKQSIQISTQADE